MTAKTSRKAAPRAQPKARAVRPTVNPNLITNRAPGVTLHLGDGRKLKTGESAEVSSDLAASLRERGLVE